MNFRMIDLENECRKALQYSQVREKTVVGDVIQVFSLLATGYWRKSARAGSLKLRCHTDVTPRLMIFVVEAAPNTLGRRVWDKSKGSGNDIRRWKYAV